MRVNKYIPYLCIVLASCTDEINLSSTESTKTLVVDGEISDQEGPYTVKISYSKDFFDDDLTSLKNQVSNAEVRIEDDKGNFEILQEIEVGVYQTSINGLRGQVGNSYKLIINLENGSQYESFPSTILPNSGIKELKTEYIQKQVLNSNSIELLTDGIDVSVIPNEMSTSSEYYRWRWAGTYEIETFPQLRMKTVLREQFEHNADEQLTIDIADPIPCSGFIAITPSGAIAPTAVVSATPCTCCICWVTEYSTQVKVSSTVIQSPRILLNFIENGESRFITKYHLNVQQLSISKEERAFWEIVEQQQQDGSIFSTANAAVPSNIFNTFDNSENVLGFFSAVSISERNTVLTFDDLQRDPVVIDSLKTDCTGLPNSTNQIPDFW